MKLLMTIVVLSIGCHVLMADDLVKRGERLLGIGINEGSIGFDKAFPVAQSTGMQFVELPQQWDEIEPKPGKFTNSDMNFTQVTRADSFHGVTFDSIRLRFPDPRLPVILTEMAMLTLPTLTSSALTGSCRARPIRKAT